MKRLSSTEHFLITPLVILLFLFPMNPSPAQEKKINGPQVLIEETLFDLGEIEKGSPATHTYIIKNIGDEDLKIAKYKHT